MNDPRTTKPEIIGIEVGSGVVRGARIDCGTNEIVAVDEVPFNRSGVDHDGIIDPSVVGIAVDTLVMRLGVQDRSLVQVGMSVGPRNAGVGSGPAMPDWLRSQATRLEQPLVCSGGLGVAFVPIRAVDQAVKTAFDVGLELSRVDLAPVAAARAIGDQVDDLVCVGSGLGWQARMRDFEVLEAMENSRVGPEEPVSVIGPQGCHGIARYGWIDLSQELTRSRQVDVGRMATAVGTAVGVLYESPANLLNGKVIGAAESVARTTSDQRIEVRSTTTAERTVQLNVVPGHAATIVETPAEARAKVLVGTGGRSSGDAGSASTTRSTATTERPAAEMARPEAAEPALGQDLLHADDPINLFSPEGDESTILGKRRFGWFTMLLLVLLVLAVSLGAAYLFG